MTLPVQPGRRRQVPQEVQDIAAAGDTCGRPRAVTVTGMTAAGTVNCGFCHEIFSQNF